MKRPLNIALLAALAMATAVPHGFARHRHVHSARTHVSRAPADEDDHAEDISYAVGSASSSGNVSQLRALFARGASANYMYENGQQPLLIAVSGAHIDAVRLLIAHGANLYGENNGGYSALDIAEERKRFASDPVLRAKYDKIIAVLINAERKHKMQYNRHFSGRFAPLSSAVRPQDIGFLCTKQEVIPLTEKDVQKRLWAAGFPSY